MTDAGHSSLWSRPLSQWTLRSRLTAKLIAFGAFLAAWCLHWHHWYAHARAVRAISRAHLVAEVAISSLLVAVLLFGFRDFARASKSLLTRRTPTLRQTLMCGAALLLFLAYVTLDRRLKGGMAPPAP